MSVDVKLLDLLNDYNPAVRKEAVSQIASLRANNSWCPPAVRPWMNIHAHTFHSFNSNGWSPSRLVYESIEAGLEIFGSVDFDVMDAVLEVLEVADLLGIKAVAGLETRIFIEEYASQVMNSPGEPGISYFMLTGITQLPQPGSESEATLSSLKKIAQDRNKAMMARVNPYLDPVVVDYEKDLIPMTPSGNPTERHLVEAYDRKAQQVFAGDTARLATYWAEKMGLPLEKVQSLLADSNAFQDTLRSKIMKKGGVGYIDPDPSRFPTLTAMVDLGRAIGALPTATWLDGVNEGESAIQKLLEFFISKGIVALNIIPDRNWNIKNPDEKKLKIAKLQEVVETARDLDLPLSIGTEMNKAGQPFVDAFDAPELAPFVEDFRKGARTIWGHTILARTLDFGWLSPKAASAFGDSRRARFDFYHEIGKNLQPGKAQFEDLRKQKADPDTLLAYCRRQIGK